MHRIAQVKGKLTNASTPMVGRNTLERIRTFKVNKNTVFDNTLLVEWQSVKFHLSTPNKVYDNDDDDESDLRCRWNAVDDEE